MRTYQIAVVSTTVAATQGYRALADVADIAQGANYRVIGGHMVQLLLHVYPTSNAHVRLTADADAGVEQQAAAAGNLHEGLLAAGYEAVQPLNLEVSASLFGGDVLFQLVCARRG